MFIVTVAFGVFLGVTPSYAKSPKPTLPQIQAAKKAEAIKRAAAAAAAADLIRAAQTLQTLSSAADAATGRYNKARKELAVAITISAVAARHAQATSSAVETARRAIGKLATNAYIMGGGLTDIEPLLSANGPQDLVDRLSILGTLGAQNSTALDRYKVAEIVARSAKLEADAAKVAQAVATNRVASAKRIADAAKAAQQTEVDKLQKVQDHLMQQLANARKIRVSLEQRRQLALLEEARSNRVERTPILKKIWTDRGYKGQLTIRSTQSQRLLAVAYARAQVLARKPYVWGAQGPDAFDCSGLIYAAYKSAGLVWPQWDRLNAALYAGYTKHVPLSEILPGDLLFYSSDGTISNIYHASIYAGDGMTWDARSTRSGLRYGSIYDLQGLMPFGGRV